MVLSYVSKYIHEYIYNVIKNRDKVMISSCLKILFLF